MALCPDHGGYTGDACRKCQEPRKPECDLCFEEEGSYSCVRPAHGAGKIGPPPLPQKSQDVSKPPKIDNHDRLTLTQLENISLKSFHRMQNAQAQFQNFAQTMFEKYKVKPSEYTLDMEKLEFVARAL